MSTLTKRILASLAILLFILFLLFQSIGYLVNVAATPAGLILAVLILVIIVAGFVMLIRKIK